MNTHTLSNSIDTRVVFKIYAIAAWVSGACLLAWGPLWFGVDLPGIPYGKAVPVRILGAMVVAAGFFARAAAGADDPEVRRRGLLWFAWGHAIVLLVLILQVQAILDWKGVAANMALGALFLSTGLFFYFAQTEYGWSNLDLRVYRSWTSLFGAPAGTSADTLRSTYEEQIRAAASQEERNRLARDLHDSIKQQIFAIHTAAATAQARFEGDPAGASAAIEQIRSSAREAMTEMEVMLDQLRSAPLENNGLVEALKKQCETLGFRTGAEVHFELGSLPPSTSLAPGAQQGIFRVAQEAMANIARHARARHVLVALGSDETDVSLRVEDDGAGFEVGHEAAGMGLRNMRTRAEALGGRLTLKSHPGQGASLCLTVPRVRSSGMDLTDYAHRVFPYVIITAVFLGETVYDVVVPSRRAQAFWHVSLALVAAVPLAHLTIAYLRARRVAGRES